MDKDEYERRMEFAKADLAEASWQAALALEKFTHIDGSEWWTTFSQMVKKDRKTINNRK